MAMPKNRKWLLLPPAVALLIVLGPLSMRNDAARPQAEVATAPATEASPAVSAAPQADTTQKPKAKSSLPVPRTPDLWQVGSTLIGVLVLGGATVALLRRMRTAPTTGNTGAVTLRQTLRLAPNKTLHAVEFDGRLLLLGASEKGIALLHAGGSTADAAADEATIAQRSQAVVEADEDEGATPKNLVIPRPERPAQKLPTPPATPGSVPAEKAQKDLLHDFRALLAKAGR
jgi:flagellar biogenesis protein FliO